MARRLRNEVANVVFDSVGASRLVTIARNVCAAALPCPGFFKLALTPIGPVPDGWQTWGRGARTRKQVNY